MENDEKYIEARAKMLEIKSFYSHVVAYAAVVLVLAVVNFAASPGFLWFLLVAGGWGFGLLWHFLGVFVFRGNLGSDWEKRKIKEIMDKTENSE